MKNSNDRTVHIKKLCAVAMFCAIAFIVSFCFPIKVQFLTFDAKDAVIAIGGMFFGPIAALTMSVIVPFLEFLSFSETGLYGLIMNFLSSAAFSVSASLVYKYKRRMSGAVLGLAASIVATVCIMMLANVFVTPYYMGVSRDDVISLIPTLLLPFNATKSVLNASLVLLLYKPFTTALKATRLVPRSASKKASPVITVITVVCAVILLAAAIFIYTHVLGGSFSFFAK
ncbi:MAG: ECF transporter S component [Clostridia bacterium]|nr:ECF transporter S component [Clostridia bacterium]